MNQADYLRVLTMNAHKICTCGRGIFWAVTVAGKRMPLECQPVPGGTVDLSTGKAVVVKGEPGVLRYRAHFATCPDAAKFRKAKQ
jgi:hypothetical protein